MQKLKNVEELYSPSFWAKRFPTPIEHENFHINFIKAESGSVEVPALLNIKYGPSARQKLDIFGIDLPDSAPILTFIHGGYWQIKELERTHYHFISKAMHKNGIKSIFAGYDLCPDASLHEIVKQIKSAAEQCIKYAKEKQSKGIYFAGHSAGGHLVACIMHHIQSLSAQDRETVLGAIPISGLFDLVPVVNTSNNNALQLSESSAADLSPINFNYSDLGNSKFIVVVGQNESSEFSRQSTEFDEKLKADGVASSLVKIENVDHFNIIEMLSDEEFTLTKQIIAFINDGPL